MKCEKEGFATQRAAEEALARMVAVYKHTGHGGKSYKRLITFQCKKCGQFHLGRDNSERLQKMAEITNTKPAKKIPSYGQLLRKLRNIDKKLDNERRHRAFVLGQLIRAQALEEAARERQQYEAALAAIYGSLPTTENGRGQQRQGQ